MGLQNVEWSPDGRRLVHSGSIAPAVYGGARRFYLLYLVFGTRRNRASLKSDAPVVQERALLWVHPDEL